MTTQACYHDTKTFNLGFGDHDLVARKINDNANTENGDVYDVLNTELNTIPLFFEEYPDYARMVRVLIVEKILQQIVSVIVKSIVKMGSVEIKIEALVFIQDT